MVKYFINKDEIIVHPFSSVASVEQLLIENGYLVVKDGTIFHGIITQSDVIQTGHNLVIDCISDKRPIHGDEDIENVVHRMEQEKQHAFPVIDEEDEEYIGTITFERILKELHAMGKPPVEVLIQNVVGVHDIEEVKQRFINELSHNMKNPIQIIYSSINLYRNAKGEAEKSILLDSIYNSTKKLDEVVDKLFIKYFT